jgi:membrane peptidoglycan carboxypeptidase
MNTRKLIKNVAIAVALVAGSVTVCVFSLPWTVQLIVREAPTLSGGAAQLPSQVLGINGEVIATIRTIERFEPVHEGKLPDKLSKLVVAVEDTRFYNHQGVDLIGLGRAVYTNLAEGGVIQGGSTITQQVVKNDVVGSRRSYVRKVKEALLALRLEQERSKDDILRRYLDVAYFGDGVRGAQATAKAWFGVDAENLTLAQAALLVAVLPSPASYSPFEYPERAESRRQLVLDIAATTGSFKDSEISSARTELLIPNRPGGDSIVKTEHAWVLDSVRGELRRLAPEIDLLAGGYIVQTGIDLGIQTRSEKAIMKYLSNEDMPNGAFIALDAASGEVRAVVGGVDHTVSQVNSALGSLGGGSGRQSGSSFKPVVLAAALDAGWSLEDRVEAPALIQLPGREPAYNYDGRNWGRTTLRNATTWSINTAYMNLAEQVGIENVKQMARKLGLDPLSNGVEIAIGTDETSPLAMAAAYATFADNGRWHSPHFVVAVERNGELLWSPIIETRQVVTPEVARQIESALQEVVKKGTGSRARVNGVAISGKTGTTDNFADAWFTGWGEGLVGSSWVGHIEGLVSMRSVPGWGSISGGSLPAQIWVESLREDIKRLSDINKESSIQPETVEETSTTDESDDPQVTVSITPTPVPSSESQIDSEGVNDSEIDPDTTPSPAPTNHDSTTPLQSEPEVEKEKTMSSRTGQMSDPIEYLINN